MNLTVSVKAAVLIALVAWGVSTRSHPKVEPPVTPQVAPQVDPLESDPTCLQGPKMLPPAIAGKGIAGAQRYLFCA